MAVSVTTIYRQGLALLEESLGSTVGEVPDADMTVERTTQQTAIDILNMAQDWLCRTCLPLIDRGTISLSASVAAIDLDAVTCARHWRLWRVEALFWGVKPMRQISRETLQLFDPLYRVKTGNAPTHWYSETGVEVVLYPVPPVARGAVLTGLALPKRLVASSPAAGQTDNPDFAQDHLLTELLPTLLAIGLAKRMFDDPSVFGRLAHLTRQATARCLALWEALPDATRASLYPSPPDVEGAGF